MSIIVTDTGFAPDDWTGEILDLPPEAEAEPTDAPLIRIRFASFADGRGFTLARRLRLQGYKGRLRAAGHVIADQYAMARRAGFDEVEVPAALALRQAEPHWRFRADWQAHDHQAALRAAI